MTRGGADLSLSCAESAILSLDSHIIALRQELEGLLSIVPGPPTFRQAISSALTRPGKALHSGGGPGWAVLPLLVCEAISGRYDQCLPVAAALELFLASGDVFDDIEDREPTPALGNAPGVFQATNVGTALLMVMQVAVARLREAPVGPQTVARIVETMGEAGLRACSGQYHDLAFESQPAISLDDCLKMTELKSASLLECACRAGAMVATEDEGLIASYALFGHHLGMAAQITNDARAFASASSARSDVNCRKKTLPVVYALRNAVGSDAELLQAVYGQRGNVALKTCQRVCSVLRRMGAIQFALTVAETYRAKARYTLDQTGIDSPANRTLRVAIST